MPSRCCVPGCCSRKSSFSFPKDKSLRLQWRVAIRRAATAKGGGLWEPTSDKSSRVCIDHFTPVDFTSTLLGERRRLRASAVPSQFTFITKSTEAQRARSTRYNRRCERVLDSSVTINQANMPVSADVSQDCALTITDNEICSMECELSEEVLMNDNQTSSECNFSTINTQTNESVQCNLQSTAYFKFSHELFVNDPVAMNFYTSFENYGHFKLFFDVLGPASNHLRKFNAIPDPRDQLLLTLMKLRQAKEDLELSFMFKISLSTVGSVFTVWVNFLYFQLREINWCPESNVVTQHMPINFGRLFPSTKLILDATEVPIEKPSNAEAQSMTFSNYKNKNTAKIMVGCTPRGVVSYVSDTYGGSTSDRQIMERSTLLTTYPFDFGDSIMADRGIMVQDLFASKNVKVNTPHKLKGKHQLSAAELVEDRRIASKRIHIERVIGLAKTFKILKKEMKISRLPLANRIMFICIIMNNFRKCIVGKYA